MGGWCHTKLEKYGIEWNEFKANHDSTNEQVYTNTKRLKMCYNFSFTQEDCITVEF